MVSTFNQIQLRGRRAVALGCGVAVLAALISSASVASAQDATLKMRFVYDGTPPKVENIDPNKDRDFCGQHAIPNEKLVVNQKNKGIKNVIVHVYTRSSGKDLPKTQPAKKTHTLANDECRFEPHVVIAQTGDTLKITNPDPIGHNANLNFIRNTAQNLMIPSGQEKDIALKEEEPAPIPVDCNIHPWMRAYVVALDHPYGAISDENGALEIKGLPAGQELVFRLHHEAAQGAIREVKIDGKATPLRRNLLRLTLQPGENDLGTITLDAASLAP